MKNILEYNVDSIATPIHIVDTDILTKNLNRLKLIRENTGCKILFAVKGFSCDAILPYIAQYVDGISASSFYEARLGKDCTGKYVQTFSSAIKDGDIESIIENSDCVIFNSITQWEKYNQQTIQHGRACGIRINPEYSVVENYKVNPCHEFSRFGVRKCELKSIDFNTIDGLMFHNMCELGVEQLEETLKQVEHNFGDILRFVRWVNIGGGQLFTDDDYDLDRAIHCLNYFRRHFQIELFMEPCTAIMLNTGVLVASVIDIVDNQMKTAILDVSAICHLPDIVNFPYRSDIYNAYAPFERKYTYRLAGPTCYSGDIFGDYSFDDPLVQGQKIIFLDTAQYSMVKSIQFNGIPLPAVGTISSEEGFKVLKKYNYSNFLSII